MSKNSKLKHYKCRTCLNGSKGLELLSKMATEDKKGTKSYGTLLEDLTHININDDIINLMPQSLCSCCIRKLKAAYAFVQQVQEANDKLWSLISKSDCLQEAQIDIQSCLEIKMEDEETENKEALPKFKVEFDLKVEDPEEANPAEMKEAIPVKDVLTLKPELNNIMIDRKDNEDDIFDAEFPKPDDSTSDSDDESQTTNDSDWREEKKSDNMKNSKVKPVTSNRYKKTKETNIDDYLPTPCDQCDGVFANSRLLSRHKRHTHVSEELKVQCPYCVAKFSRRYNMYTHLRTHHKDKPIEEHITQHRKFPRQHACKQCNSSYTSKYYLLIHIKNKHNPNNPEPKKAKRVILPKKRFLCTLCGSNFYTQPSLDIHIRRHTGEKPFNCDLCDRSFYTAFDVQEHRRSHTGEKPFKCTICEKAFARAAKLKIHIRTHSNERPYKCDQCEKAFKQSKDLNIHKRIHTGERPYKCDVCQSTFSQSNSLKLHQRREQHFEIIDQIVTF